MRTFFALVLLIVAGSLSAQAAGPHVISVTVLHNGAPVEASVSAVDLGAEPPEHSTGVTQKGVFRLALWPDAAGKICFSAHARYAAALKAGPSCVAPPYPTTVTLHVK